MSIKSINIGTNGELIKTTYASLHLHPELNVEMANMTFQIGGASVHIDFKSWDEMIAFCEAHNFPYTDDRETKKAPQTQSPNKRNAN